MSKDNISLVVEIIEGAPRIYSICPREEDEAFTIALMETMKEAIEMFLVNQHQ